MGSDESNARDEDRDEAGASLNLFAQIRSSCAEVTRRAAFVRIEDAKLNDLAQRLADERWPNDDFDPASEFAGPESERLAFVITLDAINFGSGWFPMVRKRPGMSGYRTIATACKESFERQGSLSAQALRESSASLLADLLGQDLDDPGVAELMELYARAWRDLGHWLESEYDDGFSNFVDDARHSAERLVNALAKMPLYRDVSSYQGLTVPLYKRAQITAADLHRAFGASRFGRFDDLDQLTLFADNLVPHVLRCEGVLDYARSLEARIDAGDPLVLNSPEEVEVRAVAVEAVERLVAALASLGRPTSAHVIDGLLWNAGQAAEIKARPRHRTRTSYY